MKRAALFLLIVIAIFACAQAGNQTYAVIITGLGGEKDFDSQDVAS